MLLFRHINNEALDEDRKAQREVIARTQKQVQLFSSEEATETSLNRDQLNQLKAKILQFANALNYATNEVQKSEEIGKSMTTLQEKYDNMSLYMAGIPFSSVIGPEQKGITDYLDGFIPQLQVLVRVLGANINVTVMEKEIGNQIFTQFNDQTYLPIGGVNVDEEGPESNDSATIILDIINSIGEDMAALNVSGLPVNPETKRAISLRNNLKKIADKLKERLDNEDYTSAGAVKAVNRLSDRYNDLFDTVRESIGIVNSLRGGVPVEQVEEEGVRALV
jgi:protein-arginine kinase activator protein McsA